MNRLIMKNGDVVRTETYEWNKIKNSTQMDRVLNDLKSKLQQDQRDYPGHTVRFTFNSAYGNVPDQIRTTLTSLGAIVEQWP